MAGGAGPNAVDVQNCDKPQTCQLQECQLLDAAFDGSLELVKSLVTKDNLNARDAIGRTPLALACWCGHYDVAEHLLKSGADISGNFRLVSAFKHAQIVELLLQYGADVNEQYPLDAQRPLHHASERGNIEVVKVLLKWGADVKARDFYGKTALHCAVSRGSRPLTLLLLEHHADINVADRFGRTPLHYAIRYFPVTRTLLEKGACVSAFDEYDRIPLDTDGLESDVVAILVDYSCGADILCRCGCCKVCRILEAYSIHFQRYSIRTREAGIPNDNGVLLVDEWPLEAYRDECVIELARMKSEFVEGSVDYYSVLRQDLSIVKTLPFLKLTPESCRGKFPIYGDMIHCSFLRMAGELRKLQKVLLLEKCCDIFYLTDLPWLPPECARSVLSYLSFEDLSIVATLL